MRWWHVLFCPRPVRIALELPSFTRKGKLMPNFELPNDAVATITIKTTDAAGDVVPKPAGDTFQAKSAMPNSLGASIGVDAAGNPALILTPLVQLSPGINVNVLDSAGLKQASLIVDIVGDVTPSNIILDVADATLAPQPTPGAVGP